MDDSDNETLAALAKRQKKDSFTTDDSDSDSGSGGIRVRGGHGVRVRVSCGRRARRSGFRAERAIPPI